MYSYYCPQCGANSRQKSKAKIKAFKKAHRLVHQIPANKAKGGEGWLPTVKAYSCGLVTTKAGTKCRKGLVAHVNKIHVMKEKAANA